MSTDSYDILIVGGGMVGSTLACALAQQQPDLSIAILEAKQQAPVFTASHYHHRVSAIALSSQRIFQTLGVWEAIQQQRISPFTHIEVWDAQGKGEINFGAEEIAETHLGHIIENNVMQAALMEKCKSYTQIKWIAPIELTDWREEEESIVLFSRDQRSFKAKLAVAADGANSWLRTQSGFICDKKEYQQQALVVEVQTALPHQQRARQVFLETGPLAFLPLASENRCSIVWSLPHAHAEQMLNLAEQPFKQALTDAFSKRLGDIEKIEQRYTFTLYQQQAKQYVHSRKVLVGDAAHIIHPLAGQGLNMGLLDAVCLAEILKEARQKKGDLASLSHLRRYERWRKADNLTMLTCVDGIKKLFASENKSIQQLRSCGLTFLNQIEWVKNQFTSYAIGNREGLPKMAQ